MRLAWLAAGVLVLDQATKLAVRLNMEPGLHGSIPLIGDWLKLTFTENPGMAFGITFGPKGLITAFSIIATMLIVFYAVRIRKGYLPYRVSLVVILAGAIGNIIDRLFYGMLFDYGEFFGGRVVDFIHFDIWRGFVSPDLPLLGGTYLALFPIFNVSDIAIVGGVVGILIFQKKFHEQLLERPADADEAPAPPVLASADSE